MAKMKWKTVRHSINKREIGAIGFVDNKLAVIVSFYADKDANYDGKVSLGERIGGSLFSLDGRATVEVISNAYADPDIAMIDPEGIHAARGESITRFASGMIIDGIYISYFKFGVSQFCGAVASSLVRGTATRFVVKKGMEGAVKRAYKEAM